MVLAVVGAAALTNAGPREPAPTPDADFLEFLGSWHTGDDRWIDPFQVDEAPSAKDGEGNHDARSRDDLEERNTRLNPRDESKQQGRDTTMPRRDMKP